MVPLIKKLEKENNVKKILLTTSTVSSAKVFKKIKLKKTFHKFYPLDTNHITKKFISCWKPQLAIFVDSEIWPNMLLNLENLKSKIWTLALVDLRHLFFIKYKKNYKIIQVLLKII